MYCGYLTHSHLEQVNTARFIVHSALTHEHSREKARTYSYRPEMAIFTTAARASGYDRCDNCEVIGDAAAGKTHNDSWRKTNTHTHTEQIAEEIGGLRETGAQAKQQSRASTKATFVCTWASVLYEIEHRDADAEHDNRLSQCSSHGGCTRVIHECIMSVLLQSHLQGYANGVHVLFKQILILNLSSNQSNKIG